MVKPDNEFKAVFNPFNRKLSVLYGLALMNYTFDEIEEWVKMSMDNDPCRDEYLHIQLDYDESLQLLFYPRVEGSPHLNENIGVYFNSLHMDEIPEQIQIVYNDEEYEDAVSELRMYAASESDIA